MKKIITISREFGAAGETIGKLLAVRLGYELYNKELILKAAREANIGSDIGYKMDEAIPSSFGFGQSLFDFYNKPVNEQLFDAQKTSIRAIGEHGKCIIVGRNANMILKEFDDSLHVFITADKNWRINHMKTDKMQNSTEKEIAKYLETVDKKRRKYCTYYTNTEFGDAKNYDICLSSSKLGIEACVDILYNLAK